MTIFGWPNNMKPDKNNKRRRIKRLDTPPSAIIVGALLGIGMAVSLYMFQYAMFEALRMTSLVNQLDFVFLSDIVRQRNNLYMAGFAAVFGHSVALAYLLKVGYTGQVKQRYLLRMTIHDQRSLSWYTLLWMTSFLWLLSILLFSVFGMATINIPNAFFNFLVVLALVVLLLHSYIGLRRLFRSNMYRWMLVSTLSILLVGLTLSRWHPINTKANDELVKKAYPILQNPLEYPEVVHYKRIWKRSWTDVLYVQYDTSIHELLLFAQDQQLELNDIKRYLTVYHETTQIDLRPFATLVLAADKNLSMREINSVIEEVLLTSYRHIGFAVNSARYTGKNAYRIIPIKYPHYQLIRQGEVKYKHRVDIGADGCWFIDRRPVTEQELLDIFYSKIASRDTEFTLHYENTLCLDQYIKTYDLFYEALLKYKNVADFDALARQATSHYNLKEHATENKRPTHLVDFQVDSIMSNYELEWNLAFLLGN